MQRIEEQALSASQKSPNLLFYDTDDKAIAKDRQKELIDRLNKHNTSISFTFEARKNGNLPLWIAL